MRIKSKKPKKPSNIKRASFLLANISDSLHLKPSQKKNPSFLFFSCCFKQIKSPNSYPHQNKDMVARNRVSTHDLPPGFRFHPTDEELIIHYLKKQATSTTSCPVSTIIPVVDIYKFDPWQLPGTAQ